MRFFFCFFGLLLAGGYYAGLAFGQAQEVKDGNWRHHFGAGTTYTSGNNDTSSFGFNADSVRTDYDEKLELLGKVQLSRSDGKTTGEVGRVGARYQREISSHDVYGFGQAELLRDTAAKVRSRYTFANGGGIHLLRTDDDRFDVFGGIGYAQDRFTELNEVGGSLRERYSRFELLFGLESFHRFTENTTLKQRMVVYPNLTNRGDYRAEFDVGLSVAMNKALSLTTNLAYRYNSDPGLGLDSQDLTLMTALTWQTN